MLTFALLTPLVLYQACSQDLEPSSRFLDSTLMLRPGVIDYPDLTVRGFVQRLLQIAGDDSGSQLTAKWNQDPNGYTFLIAERPSLALRFVRISRVELSARFWWLESVTSKDFVIPAFEFASAVQEGDWTSVKRLLDSPPPPENGWNSFRGRNPEEDENGDPIPQIFTSSIEPVEDGYRMTRFTQFYNVEWGWRVTLHNQTDTPLWVSITYLLRDEHGFVVARDHSGGSLEARSESTIRNRAQPIALREALRVRESIYTISHINVTSTSIALRALPQVDNVRPPINAWKSYTEGAAIIEQSDLEVLEDAWILLQPGPLSHAWGWKLRVRNKATRDMKIQVEYRLLDQDELKLITATGSRRIEAGETALLQKGPISSDGPTLEMARGRSYTIFMEPVSP